MFRTIRSRLYVVVGLAALTFVGIAAHAASAAWRARRDAELNANLEIARTVANALRIHVDDVVHDCGALGRTIASQRLSRDDANRLLADAVSDYVAVREFSWVGLDGRIAYSSNPSAIGVSIVGRDYYQRVLAGEDHVVSDLLHARVDGRPGIVVARAIRAPAGGGLAGTVIAVIAPDGLGLHALPLAREGNAAVALFDRAGRLVYRSPDAELDWDARAAAGAEPIVRQALGGRDASGDVRGEAGDVRLGAAVPVASLGWAVRASRSADEALGPLRREIVAVLAAGVLVSLLALAASSVVGTRTVAALRRLERHAEHLGAGKKPRRPLRGPEEITRLGRAYERMADGLIASQARFAAVADELPSAVLVLDGELRARWANRAAIAFVEEPLRTAGVVGRSIEELVPGAAAAGLVEALRAVSRDGETRGQDEACLDGFSRGTTFWSWSGRVLPGVAGDRELLLVASDVTEQVRAREQIEADRRRLECLLKTLPAGVFIADGSGQLVQANDEARRIWGGRAPLRHARAHALYHGRFADTGEALAPADWPTQRALVTGQPVPSRLVEIERFDGRAATVLTGAQPIVDAEGQVTGAVATALDVTELERAIRRRDEVLQIVSHDLRNPLATVTLGAATLARLPDGAGAGAQARRAAVRISAAGKRMTRLIEDLLDLSSLDEGRLSLRRTPCHPADLIGAAAEELREAAREKGLDLCLSATPGLPEVDADRDRILQVLANVASNAVKATDEGAVCLAAEAHGDAVVFRVRDTGPGIPEEELPHVFDRFRRGADAQWRGTGLGLAIARALVEAHGGAIRAESRPGEGTTVSFTLPVARQVELPEDEGESSRGEERDELGAAAAV